MEPKVSRRSLVGAWLWHQSQDGWVKLASAGSEAKGTSDALLKQLVCPAVFWAIYQRHIQFSITISAQNVQPSINSHKNHDCLKTKGPRKGSSSSHWCHCSNDCARSVGAQKIVLIDLFLLPSKSLHGKHAVTNTSWRETENSSKQSPVTVVFLPVFASRERFLSDWVCEAQLLFPGFMGSMCNWVSAVQGLNQGWHLWDRPWNRTLRTNSTAQTSKLGKSPKTNQDKLTWLQKSLKRLLSDCLQVS